VKPKLLFQQVIAFEVVCLYNTVLHEAKIFGAIMMRSHALASIAAFGDTICNGHFGARYFCALSARLNLSSRNKLCSSTCHAGA
jgi:hypothetical protein